jgi:hypothetical protein
MAIASRTAAITQYQASLRYWTSTATAENLLEAILYLLQEDAQSWSVGGQSITRQNLEKLQTNVMDFVVAGSSSRPAMFSRTRVTGMGDRT